jgi:hypothetical protein
MAAVDKTYGTFEQYKELYVWLKDNAPILIRSMNYAPQNDEKTHYIAMFSMPDDIFLYYHCPIKWLREQIEESYGGPPELPESYWKETRYDFNYNQMLKGA